MGQTSVSGVVIFRQKEFRLNEAKHPGSSQPATVDLGPSPRPPQSSPLSVCSHSSRLRHQLFPTRLSPVSSPRASAQREAGQAPTQPLQCLLSQNLPSLPTWISKPQNSKERSPNRCSLQRTFSPTSQRSSWGFVTQRPGGLNRDVCMCVCDCICVPVWVFVGPIIFSPWTYPIGIRLCYLDSWTLQGALVVKKLPANEGDVRDVWLQGREDYLDEGMATHSSILAWRAAVVGSHRPDTSEVTEHPRGAEHSLRDGRC